MVSRAGQVVGDALHVVLGARSAQLAGLLEGLPGKAVINPQWQEGIGSSIRAGVASLPADCAGVLMLLADQAAVTTEDLERLVSAWAEEPSRIVAASYGGRTGVPALFPRRCFPALGMLQGDTGARALLRQDPERVRAVPMPHAALDIDTPEDARRFQEELAASAAARTR
jgi:CTP:molybdopterin cytidylyltransferase MocA